MILAITHAGDEHAPPLLDALARLGAEAVVLDLADLPVRGGVVLGYGAGAGGLELRLDGRAPIRARDVSAVWWRRPRPFVADPALAPVHQSFATRQAGDAVMGFLSSLDARFVNDPWAAHRAEHKTGQLAAAERAGLAVPRTCVTTDPAAARAFLDACGPGGAVHKQLHRLPGDGRPTRRVEPEDLARLPAIRQAPPIFQEYVAGVDIRATVVGDAVFAAEIDARGTSTPEDFRESVDACPMAACELPADVAVRLRALCRSLGLTYAAIDLRRREDRALFFLEANPAGQYLFVEDRTGQPMTAALAALLAGPR